MSNAAFFYEGVLAVIHDICLFSPSVSAVYLLRLQEELLLSVLRASGESAHLCHMSFAEGNSISAAAAHAPTSQGLASVLAAP